MLNIFLVAGVTGILPTEIFNQTARPAAYMIAGSLMWLNLFVVGMIFPFLVVREQHSYILYSTLQETEWFKIIAWISALIAHIT